MGEAPPPKSGASCLMIQATDLRCWYHGNSNKTFLANQAPQLTFKEWNKAMTAYLSAWTGRNSYGIGATERIMIERAVDNLYR